MNEPQEQWGPVIGETQVVLPKRLIVSMLRVFVIALGKQSGFRVARDSMMVFLRKVEQGNYDAK